MQREASFGPLYIDTHSSTLSFLYFLPSTTYIYNYIYIYIFLLLPCVQAKPEIHSQMKQAVAKATVALQRVDASPPVIWGFQNSPRVLEAAVNSIEHFQQIVDQSIHNRTATSKLKRKSTIEVLAPGSNNAEKERLSEKVILMNDVEHRLTLPRDRTRMRICRSRKKRLLGRTNSCMSLKSTGRSTCEISGLCKDVVPSQGICRCMAF